MSDYIKREDAERLLRYDFLGALTEDERVNELNMIPSADVVEVRHGRWEDGKGNLMRWGSHLTYCSECHEESEYMDRFCGNCGAKMIALGERFDAKAQTWKEVECEMDEEWIGMDGEEE